MRRVPRKRTRLANSGPPFPPLRTAFSPHSSRLTRSAAFLQVPHILLLHPILLLLPPLPLHRLDRRVHLFLQERLEVSQRRDGDGRFGGVSESESRLRERKGGVGRRRRGRERVGVEDVEEVAVEGRAVSGVGEGREKDTHLLPTRNAIRPPSFFFPSSTCNNSAAAPPPALPDALTNSSSASTSPCCAR